MNDFFQESCEVRELLRSEDVCKAVDDLIAVIYSRIIYPTAFEKAVLQWRKAVLDNCMGF